MLKERLPTVKSNALLRCVEVGPRRPAPYVSSVGVAGCQSLTCGAEAGFP
jgi:hypothetical protein